MILDQDENSPSNIYFECSLKFQNLRREFLTPRDVATRGLHMHRNF